MRKWLPTIYVDTATGEVLPCNFKELYYFKKIDQQEHCENKNGITIIQDIQIIKIYGRKEKQLNLF